MPQAIVDPEALEEFARSLKQFKTDLGSRSGALRGKFTKLCETWRDAERQKFSREFDQTMRVIQRFIRVADEQITYLKKKAAPVREYLQR
jgi:uncharacterized protein YukE